MKRFLTKEGAYYEADQPLAQDHIEVKSLPDNNDNGVISTTSKIHLTPAHLWVVIVLSFTIAGTYYNNLQRIASLESTTNDFKAQMERKNASDDAKFTKIYDKLDEMTKMLYDKNTKKKED